MSVKKLLGEVRFHAKRTWTWSWLYMAGATLVIVLAEETVTTDGPVIIGFCVLMALIGHQFNFKSPSLFVASAFGTIATLLVLPASANLGVFHLELWGMIGVCFLAAAITVLPYSLMFGKRQKEIAEDKEDKSA